MTKSATARSSGPNRKSVGKRSVTNSGPGNKKYFVVSAVIALGLAGMIFAAMPDADAPKPSASVTPRSGAAVIPGSGTALTSREPSFNFGTVSMASGKVTHRYRIANDSADPIVIRKLYTSCMCTTASLLKGVQEFGPFGMPGHSPIPAINQTLAPRESAYVDVVFDPAAHGPAGIGPIERVVTIENSARQPLELAFSAHVTP